MSARRRRPAAARAPVTPPRAPRMSVLIPAYRAAYLRQAIASVLAQGFEDYEIIISDDCPNDTVRRVVREFRDARMRLVQGPKRGLVPNSAFLFTQASGEFVKFVYDDDFLLPFALQTLVRALDDHPRASFSVTKRHLVGVDGAIIRSPDNIAVDRTREVPSSRIISMLLSRIHNLLGEPTNCLFRRSAFKDASGLSRYASFEIRHLIDLCSYLNAFDVSHCVLVPEFHSAFRVHGGQTSDPEGPAFSAAIFEWELFLRGEFSRGRCSGEAALEGVTLLNRVLYRDEYVTRFPELSSFRQGIPELSERIRSGDTDLLDDNFRALWTKANAAIDARLAVERRSIVAPSLSSVASRPRIT